AITTPIPVLIGLGLAVVFTVRNASRQTMVRPLRWAWWIWLIWVLGVFSSGRIALFDGIRHFLLVCPPLAVLSAWGLQKRFEVFEDHVPRAGRPWLVPTALGAVLVMSINSILLYHPYEITYFNALVGGLPGATRIHFGPTVLDSDPR